MEQWEEAISQATLDPCSKVRKQAESYLNQQLLLAPAIAFQLTVYMLDDKAQKLESRLAAGTFLKQVVSNNTWTYQQPQKMEQLKEVLMRNMLETNTKLKKVTGAVIASAYSLASQHWKELIPSLIGAVGSQLPEVRHGVVIVLGEIAQRLVHSQIVQNLARSCRDKESVIRVAALQALANIFSGTKPYHGQIPETLHSLSLVLQGGQKEEVVLSLQCLTDLCQNYYTAFNQETQTLTFDALQRLVCSPLHQDLSIARLVLEVYCTTATRYQKLVKLGVKAPDLLKPYHPQILQVLRGYLEIDRPESEQLGELCQRAGLTLFEVARTFQVSLVAGLIQSCRGLLESKTKANLRSGMMLFSSLLSNENVEVVDLALQRVFSLVMDQVVSPDPRLRQAATKSFCQMTEQFASQTAGKLNAEGRLRDVLNALKDQFAIAQNAQFALLNLYKSKRVVLSEVEGQVLQMVVMRALDPSAPAKFIQQSFFVLIEMLDLCSDPSLIQKYIGWTLQHIRQVNVVLQSPTLQLQLNGLYTVLYICLQWANSKDKKLLAGQVLEDIHREVIRLFQLNQEVSGEGFDILGEVVSLMDEGYRPLLDQLWTYLEYTLDYRWQEPDLLTDSVNLFTTVVQSLGTDLGDRAALHLRIIQLYSMTGIGPKTAILISISQAAQTLGCNFAFREQAVDLLRQTLDSHLKSLQQEKEFFFAVIDAYTRLIHVFRIQNKLKQYGLLALGNKLVLLVQRIADEANYPDPLVTLHKAKLQVLGVASFRCRSPQFTDNKKLTRALATLSAGIQSKHYEGHELTEAEKFLGLGLANSHFLS